MEVSNIKKALRIESTICFASRSSESLGRTTYLATVGVKLIMEIEGEEEREKNATKQKKQSSSYDKVRR